MSLPRRRKFSVSPTVCVVIGGGVAGVSCATELHRLTDDRTDHTRTNNHIYGAWSDVKAAIRIVLISASELLKQTLCIHRHTQLIEELELNEISAEVLKELYPRLEILIDSVIRIDLDKKTLFTSTGATISYNSLCLCIGSSPKRLLPNLSTYHPSLNNRIMYLRDTFSVSQLSSALSSARVAAVIGNGGIALELVHALTFCDVVWIMRESYLGGTFLDASASAFIEPSLHERIARCTLNPSTSSQLSLANNGHNQMRSSSAGPHWQTNRDFINLKENTRGSMGHLHLEKNQEVVAVRLGDARGEWIVCEGHASEEIITEKENENQRLEAECWPLLLLTNIGSIIGCDVAVVAIGVEPASSIEMIGEVALDIDEGGWFMVDKRFRTSRAGVYAAGDGCHVNIELDRRSDAASDDNEEPITWQQMRLWSQAKAMGASTARSILSDIHSLTTLPSWNPYSKDPSIDNCFPFHLFSHATNFFNFKVILLGRFNAQFIADGEDREIAIKNVVVKSGMIGRERVKSESKLFNVSSKIELWYRITDRIEYLKIVVHCGRIVGAILVGDTGLEETMENLILNGTDVSSLGAAILDPEREVEDYFD